MTSRNPLPSSADLSSLLAEATPGPWWPSSCQGPKHVDRGKVYTHVDHPIRLLCVLSANTQVPEWAPYAANSRLAALAPDLAAEVVHLRRVLGSLEWSGGTAEDPECPVCGADGPAHSIPAMAHRRECRLAAALRVPE